MIFKKLILRFYIIVCVLIASIHAEASVTDAVGTVITDPNAWGEDCDLVPIDRAEGINEGVYSFVKSKINVKHPKIPPDQRCENKQNNEITLCVKNTSNTECDLVTFKVGSKIKMLSGDVYPGQKNGLLGDIEFRTEVIRNQICVTMPTSRGPAPLVCKLTNFNDKEGYLGNCRVDPSCYDESASKTASPFSFSGKAVQCIKHTLDRIMYDGGVCRQLDKEDNVINLYEDFQIIMRRAVFASLVLYTMVFGFKVMLNPYQINLNQLAMYVIKLVLVLYFSVGFRAENFDFNGSIKDGMTEVTMPVLMSMMNSTANMVLNAGGARGICQFSPEDYPAGYSYYAIFDSIDCRIGHYLGQQISRFVLPTGHADNDWSSDQGRFDGIGRYIGTLFYAILGGQLIIVSLSIWALIMYLSIFLTFVSTYILCLISLYVVGYLAPIFVPMALFEKTKSYFDSWWRLLVSFTLRPMVIAGFMALILTAIDTRFYGDCEFEEKKLGKYKYYGVKDSNNLSEECKNSMWYKLERIYNGQDSKVRNLLVFQARTWTDKNGFLAVLLKTTVSMTIFFYFATIINQFASDITGGGNVGIGGMVIDPQAFARKAWKKLHGKSKQKARQEAGNKRKSDALRRVQASGDGGGANDSIKGGEVKGTGKGDEK